MAKLAVRRIRQPDRHLSADHASLIALAQPENSGLHIKLPLDHNVGTMRNRALWLLAAFMLLSLYPVSAGSRVADKTSRAFRKPAENGWVMVHLEGKPAEIGFQHGSLLAPEIEDAF